MSNCRQAPNQKRDTPKGSMPGTPPTLQGERRTPDVPEEARDASRSRLVRVASKVEAVDSSPGQTGSIQSTESGHGDGHPTGSTEVSAESASGSIAVHDKHSTNVDTDARPTLSESVSSASNATSGSASGTTSGSLSRTSGSSTSRRSSGNTSSSTWTSSSGRRSGSGGTSFASRSDSKSETSSRRPIDTIDEETSGQDVGQLGRRGELHAVDEDGEDDDQQEQRVTSPAAPSTPSTPSWPGSEADWGEEKWLAMADHLDAQRRTTTMAGWEARKQKYPELFRTDVHPSYTQFQVPYWSVCRRRYGRAMQRINRRLAEDIEELALLQTRALDGVRVVRCFSLGARPHPSPPDPLTASQRRRVEQLLA